MPFDPDLVLRALAHSARRRMIDLLVEHPGMSVKAVASHFDFSRIATMKHLATLESAGLVISEKHGRTRKLYFNPVPIQEIYRRWIRPFEALPADRLLRIKRLAEARDARPPRRKETTK